MSVCEATRPAPLRCPAASEILASVLMLLPKGRAWQSNEGGPRAGNEIAFQPIAFDGDSFLTTYRKPSILLRFWKSVAEVYAFVNQRLCDLRLEFWCATQSETRDLWMSEYGLPDSCDPFPDLCTKVAALGGTRCDYYQFIAERAGWSIACRDQSNVCGSRPGGRTALAGRMRLGASRGAALTIVVDLANSPAFVGARYARLLAGRMRAGRRLSCGPNLGALECLLARVVHAEIEITYEVI